MLCDVFRIVMKHLLLIFSNDAVDNVWIGLIGLDRGCTYSVCYFRSSVWNRLCADHHLCQMFMKNLIIHFLVTVQFPINCRVSQWSVATSTWSVATSTQSVATSAQSVATSTQSCMSR